MKQNNIKIMLISIIVDLTQLPLSYTITILLFVDENELIIYM